MNKIEQSIVDTNLHKAKVKEYIYKIIDELKLRAEYHDSSKLMSPELEVFAEYTPKLKGTEFGTEKYDKQLKEMDIAIKHHYANNRHHPDHWPLGINDMDLIDILEMVIDWKASSLRQNTGNAICDITKNKERFNYSEDLHNIFKNTLRIFE